MGAHPRGKVIGGSSSINGMVYMRGNPDTRITATIRYSGWGFDDVLPYFKIKTSKEERIIIMQGEHYGLVILLKYILLLKLTLVLGA